MSPSASTKWANPRAFSASTIISWLSGCGRTDMPSDPETGEKRNLVTVRRAGSRAWRRYGIGHGGPYSSGEPAPRRVQPRGAATTRARQPARQPAPQDRRARPPPGAARRRATRPGPVGRARAASAAASARSGWASRTASAGSPAASAGRRPPPASSIPSTAATAPACSCSAWPSCSAVAVWFGSRRAGRRLAGRHRPALPRRRSPSLLPLLLLVGAVRLMREPGRPGAPRPVGLVGWTALIVATAALLHLGAAARPTTLEHGLAPAACSAAASARCWSAR